MNFVNGINRDQFIMMDFEANVASAFYIASLSAFYFLNLQQQIPFFAKLQLINLKGSSVGCSFLKIEGFLRSLPRFFWGLPLGFIKGNRNTFNINVQNEQLIDWCS